MSDAASLLALLILGAAVLAAGIALAFLRQIASASAISLVGLVLCILGGYFPLQHLTVDFVNGRLDLEGKRATSDVAAQIADLTLRVNGLADRLTNGVPSAQPPQGDVSNGDRAKNLAVIVYYRDGREADAKTLVYELIKQGYGAAFVASNLLEVSLKPRPAAGGAGLVANAKGNAARPFVAKTIASLFYQGQLSSIESQGPYGIQNGDLQVYLF